MGKRTFGVQLAGCGHTYSGYDFKPWPKCPSCMRAGVKAVAVARRDRQDRRAPVKEAERLAKILRNTVRLADLATTDVTTYIRPTPEREALPSGDLLRMVGCESCGVRYLPRMPNQRFCSPICRRRDYRVKNPDQYPVEPWNDRRRDAYHRRRARKKGAQSSGRVYFSKVATRDAWICQICGRPVDAQLKWPDPQSKSLDHVVPLSKGGSHSFENVQLAHLQCNVHKGSRIETRTMATSARLVR